MSHLEKADVTTAHNIMLYAVRAHIIEIFGSSPIPVKEKKKKRRVQI